MYIFKLLYIYIFEYVYVRVYVYIHKNTSYLYKWVRRHKGI